MPAHTAIAHGSGKKTCDPILLPNTAPIPFNSTIPCLEMLAPSIAGNHLSAYPGLHPGNGCSNGMLTSTEISGER